MILPLPSASITLPLDNLPPTPPPTHSSASSSPIMDGSRHADANSNTSNNCHRSTSAPLDRSPACANNNLKTERKENDTVIGLKVSSAHTVVLASCSSVTSEPMNDENAASSTNMTHSLRGDNHVVPITAESSTLKRDADCSATVSEPSRVAYHTSNERQNAETKRNRAGCGRESTKSVQISDSGIMTETLSKFLLAIAPVQKSGNDRSVDWNRRKPRAPPEASPPVDADRDQDASPISSRAARKLKIYTMEEKLDIVDFAVVIGNRAAGREYGVAESSIREWRKNEKKYRQNVAINVDKTRIEYACPWVMKEIDAKLLLFVNERKDRGVDWYDIRERGQEIWSSIINSGQLANTNYTISAINFTMGWVSRFMNRNSEFVSNIPKPIVATNTALNNNAIAPLNFSETKERSSESTLLRWAETRPGSHIVASTSLKRPSSSLRGEISEPETSSPKRVKKSKFNATNDMIVLPPYDFSTEAAQRLLNSSTGTSSRRKSHPRRLMPDDSFLIATTTNDSGSKIRDSPNRTRSPSKSTHKPLEPEHSSIFNSNNNSNNNDMLSVIAKMWMDKDASTNRKRPSADLKIVTPTADRPKQPTNSQQQQQQQQQQYQQQLFRQIALLMASLPDMNNSQASAPPATVNDNHNNNVTSAFFPLALNANAMAALQLIQNMPRFASKDDVKLTK